MPDDLRKAEVIETTVSEVTAELVRRGLDPHDRITVRIEPGDWLTRARQASRRLVIEAGLSDDDIDRLIKQAQREVEPKLG